MRDVYHEELDSISSTLVEMTGLEEFHGEISSKDYPYMKPDVQTTPWNAKLMAVIDPFGRRRPTS